MNCLKGLSGRECPKSYILNLRLQVTRVRFRKDGKLFVAEGYENIPKQLHHYIIARIKTLSQTMKLDVNDRPQDGKIVRNILGRNISMSVVSYPTIHGEGILFYKINTFADLDSMTIEELFNHDTELIGNFKGGF
jgi:type II secretory ATPase GspE/PulE/Tfp pilus assembly ATPase PilB-like protein